METKKILDEIDKQFYELKEKHPDAILLFSGNIYYEAYYDDAIEVAKTLGINYTHSTEDKNRKVVAFPHHALDTYLPKLIRTGHRVAILEKWEKPAPTVKRTINELKK